MKVNKNYFPDVNLNLNVRGMPQSATLAINERSAAMEAAGEKVFRLGLGQSPFPVPDSVVEALRTHAHEKDYLPVRGLPALRETVAEYHTRQLGFEYSADDVLIGPGSKELMFILQLVYYGDLVIPTPSWVSYAPQASIIGRKIRWLETHSYNNWRLMPEEIENLCKSDPNRPRLVILNYPANPTSVTYRLEELKHLAHVARKYRVILLSDEIYSELHYRGQHVSIARFYPEGTIVSNGLSKWCGAGGWRLGTFLVPKSLHWLLQAMAVVASETYTSISAPIQYAAIRAFQGGEDIDAYLHLSRKILRLLGRYIWDQFRRTGISVAEPQGAFYIFPDFSPFREKLARRGIYTSMDLCEQLLADTGVAILPGSVFGRPETELTARLAFVDFDGAVSLKAANGGKTDRQLGGDFLNTICPNIVEATRRICEWVSA
ncbi:MAG TPA: aminotransferase class I/II-fold pyridoxal phosphate-dependent enzyme [Bacteroidetes bacterium]|nr:aminotransferase class I/II-fold pyridoxal phosphate-dependent enzyme [Bacteroidota bacterium]